LFLPEPAEQSADVHDSRDTNDREWMMLAEGRLPVDVAADEKRFARALRHWHRHWHWHGLCCFELRVLRHGPAIVFDFTNK
jgi:hypothetical protein